MVDTNVVIDFLATREPFYKASTEVITKCASGEIEGYIAIHSITNLWYILRKTSEEMRRKWLLDICEFLQIGGISHEDVVKAIGMKDFKDFEDCLQEECAVAISADYIVTRNTKDFASSRVPAILPDEFLEKCE